MLKLKDLERRVYDGKRCVCFDCTIRNNKKEFLFDARFKAGSHERAWNMLIVLQGRAMEAESQVYNFAYVVPKDNLPLELIAAIGLKCFQLHLKEEIETKMNYDFILGEILSGM